MVVTPSHLARCASIVQTCTSFGIFARTVFFAVFDLVVLFAGCAKEKILITDKSKKMYFCIACYLNRINDIQKISYQNYN